MCDRRTGDRYALAFPFLPIRTVRRTGTRASVPPTRNRCEADDTQNSNTINSQGRTPLRSLNACENSHSRQINDTLPTRHQPMAAQSHSPPGAEARDGVPYCGVEEWDIGWDTPVPTSHGHSCRKLPIIDSFLKCGGRGDCFRIKAAWYLRLPLTRLSLSLITVPDDAILGMALHTFCIKL